MANRRHLLGRRGIGGMEVLEELFLHAFHPSNTSTSLQNRHMVVVAEK